MINTLFVGLSVCLGGCWTLAALMTLKEQDRRSYMSYNMPDYIMFFIICMVIWPLFVINWKVDWARMVHNFLDKLPSWDDWL